VIEGMAQSSVALAEKVTLAEHAPVAAFTTMFAGQVRSGASISATLTVAVLLRIEGQVVELSFAR
jgi:hypothetical protein